MSKRSAEEEWRRVLALLRAHPELLKRLAAGEDIGAGVAAGLAGPGPGPGRPLDPPEERVLRLVRRALLAEAIYRGFVRLSGLPPADRAEIERAQGRRGLADAVAGRILHCSASTIERARLACLQGGLIYPLGVERRPMSRSAWEDLKAMMLLALRN